MQEEQKAVSEGKQADVIEGYKIRLAEAEETLSKKDKAYAWNTIEGQIKTKAIQSGCQDPAKLLKLMEETDFKVLKSDMGDNYQLNSDNLDQVMARLHKENNFLFKTNKKLNDLPPTTKSPAQKTVSEMSAKELDQRTDSMLGAWIDKM
jgi:hypothetical protein